MRLKIPKPGVAWSFLVFSLGALLNYFGSNPRILYLPAIGLCGFIMFLTHDYISSQLAPPKETQQQTAVDPAGSQGNSRQRLRARMGILQAVIQDIHPTGNPRGRLLMNVKNFGQTPAHNVRIDVTIWWMPKSDKNAVARLPVDFPYSTIAPGETASKEAIPSNDYFAPGQDKITFTNLHTEPPIFSSEFMAAHSLYFYGSVAYNDDFGDRHYYDFCFLYRLDLPPPQNLVAADGHNGDRSPISH